MAQPVFYRAHPTKRLFDALVVVPADAVVDRDEHPVAGTLLPMPGIDGLRPHAFEEPLRGGVVRGTAFGARRPRRAVAVHERQPSGLPAVASAVGMHQGMRSLRRRLRGPDEHPVGKLPRWDRNRPCTRRSCRRGSRSPARGAPFPSPALIPGDVRGPLLVRHPSREVAVGEAAGSRRGLALV